MAMWLCSWRLESRFFACSPAWPATVRLFGPPATLFGSLTPPIAELSPERLGLPSHGNYWELQKFKMAMGQWVLKLG